MSLSYSEEPSLPASDFVALAMRVWPGDYDPAMAQEALRSTINITARDQGRLVECVRILTDGYFFGTVPEIMVDPDYRRRGIGSLLMQRAWERSPTGLFFGAQSGNEAFFERLGYERRLVAFARKKPRH